MSNIHTLPGIRLTPSALLASMQSDIDASKVVLVAYMDKDDVVRVRWSDTTVAEISFIGRVVELRINDEVRGNKV